MLSLAITTDIFENLPDRNKSYASVAQYAKEKKNFWRIDEFLGFGNSSDKTINFTEYLNPCTSNPDIFIIDDAGMDFSASDNNEILAKIIQISTDAKKEGREPLVICKKSGKIDNSSIFG